jgi:adenylate cyclase
VCAQAVERFGGTVDKFTGDGIMELFGAPVAQEDHALRACHAGLALVTAAETYGRELLARRDLRLAVRVGLNSGEVVTSPVGKEWTAVGHTVGLAQRMESLAELGAVYLTVHTAALAQAAFRLRNLGPHAVKGSLAPIEVFALEAPLDVSARRRSGSAALVGRDRELAELKDALARAQHGQASVISIVGEAGAGKSRLCAELAAHAAATGVTVRKGSGMSHANSVPLLPVRAMFREYVGAREEDSAATTREKVAALLLGLDPSAGPCHRPTPNTGGGGRTLDCMASREVEFIFEPQQEGGYHVYAPELPGLHTQGEDLEDALESAREALALYVEGLREEGRPLDMGIVRRSLPLPA